jgi:23S rRNA pseudouridine1911/1915/1917 synthase
MVNILRERTQNAEMAPMHRLGRGTTGAIIFAKNVATRKFLAKAFRENKIEKYYLALIRGVPTEDRFTVEQPIGLVPLFSVSRFYGIRADILFFVASSAERRVSLQ